MTKEWIEERIKLAHENTVDKGFYDCPECGGSGKHIEQKEVNIEPCPSCNGTGIDPNKNIGELLMLIVSELGEALEAHRKNKFTNWKLYDSAMSKKGVRYGAKQEFLELRRTEIFQMIIKDTFEDEIADVFIRLFDLCGYVKYYISDSITDESGMIREYMGKENIGECLFIISRQICEKQIIYSLMLLMSFCRQKNIPIQKHIEAKMAYNKTRPVKHGKEY